MIVIEYEGHQQVITPTIFPDGTSQVWKLNLDEYYDKSVRVIWLWEQEVELIWINQLICLLYQSKIDIGELYIPYLPYGRQDKDISNQSTFAKAVFLEILLKEHVGKVTTLDAHSYHPDIESIYPEKYIDNAIIDSEADFIVFPDAGAKIRYNSITADEPFLVLDKVRNQLTGNIVGLEFKKDCESTQRVLNYIESNTGNSYLIIDDICDGGMTFIKTAEQIKAVDKDATISLYVTHGIFSKGLTPLHDAGIMHIFSTKSLNQFRLNKGMDSFGYDIL